MRSKKGLVSTTLRLIISLAVAAFVILIVAIFATWNSVSFLKKQDFSRAKTWSGMAKLIILPYRVITGNKIIELTAWDQGLSLLNNSEELIAAVEVFTDFKPSSLEERRRSHEELGSALTKLRALAENLRSSKLVKSSDLLENSFFWLDIAQNVWSSDKPWLVLLQNTEEVRATGGFIGSYAEIWFTPEQFGEIEIRDIYDPDGLIFTQLESPPGQKEYLSAGKGLRLPDANWDIDFPTSAERVFWFFSKVENDPREYQGIVALNLSLVEELIGIFGELQLPDLDETVTKENFSSLARQTRGDFFSGSRQKTQFLDQATVALRSRLLQANQEEIKNLQVALSVAVKNKDIQLYSSESQLQESIRLLGAAGEVKLPVEGSKNKTSFYVVSIESNVGINKANRLVTREFCYLNKFEQIELNYVFHNANKIEDRPTEEELSNADYNLSPHLGYINYQRFLFSPTDQVEEISWNGQAIKDWDTRLIATHNGEVFQEIGFLIKIPEESSGRLRLVVAPGKILDQNSQIVVEPQSGVEYQACADTR